METKPLIGGIEAGGTKFMCAVAQSHREIVAQKRILTSTPDQTITEVINFFKNYSDIEAIGIGSFGPLDLNRDSSTYGFITSTAKPGWAHTDLLGPIQESLGVKVALDTDVNCAALGEQQSEAGKSPKHLIYLTVGTGIGAGCIINGDILHGPFNTEAGHMFIPKAKDDDTFTSSCPYHKSCLEGLASGTSILARWGTPGEELPVDHPGWLLEAGYIATGIANLILCNTPERIIIGGSVIKHPNLIELIRQEVKKLLNGYIENPFIDDISNYIVLPALGDLSGLTGALKLAEAHGTI